MSLPSIIFNVSGEKIASLLISENSFQFSSASFDNDTAFIEAWQKTLTLNTKTEVKFEQIKSITKEDNDNEICINYKNSLGLPMSCNFSFDDEANTTIFFSFLLENLHLSRTEEKLSPFKAITSQLFWLAFIVAATAFAYYMAVEMANGEISEGGSRKTRAFKILIEMLGEQGVLALGGLAILIMGYFIWKRVSKPPVLTKFQ
ncbi:MAG: hypothetical protein ACOVQA_03125 [Thermoflexibacteraceae bacterium]|jgi:hypothetical protein